MTFEEPRDLRDDELLRGLGQLVKEKGRADARFVAHLAEVEERRLHLLAGFSSLFDYCLRGLGLSENEAFHRIAAARLARRFPMILELLGARALTLSAVCLVRDYLTPDNHAELLAAATHKSKREVEALLAARFPAVAARASIRSLSQRVTPRIAKPNRAASTPEAPAPYTSGHSAEPSTAAAGATPTSPATTTPAAIPPTSSSRVADATARVGVPAAGPKDSAAAANSALFRIQFDATAELKAKLEAACELMSHANPRGDFALTIEKALDVLLEKLEKQRWAKTKSTLPRKVRQTGIDSQQQSQVRKHIPHEVRRAVVERDAGCCSFVSKTGQRCNSRAFLQLHHEQPWARGGADTAENLRLLCASHNRLVAERDYGRTFMERALATSRVAVAFVTPASGPSSA